MPKSSRPSKPRKSAEEEHGEVLGGGFYAAGFDKSELQDLETRLGTGLADEIDMLRVATRRVFELSSGVDDLDEAINALRALGISATRLAGLLRAQADLGEGRDGLPQAISQAIHEVLEEMRILK